MENTRILRRPGLGGFVLILGLVSPACILNDPGVRKAVQAAEDVVFEPASTAAEPVEAAAGAAGNPWASPAREALIRAPCGQCHQPDLPTSVPAALAFYDLSEDPWFGRLKPENYDGLLRRVRGSGSIVDADKAVIESFVRCVRDHECAPAPS